MIKQLLKRTFIGFLYFNNYNLILLNYFSEVNIFSDITQSQLLLNALCDRQQEEQFCFLAQYHLKTLS